VDGEIRMSPAGGRHGQVIGKLFGRLIAFVEAKGLGYVLDGQTGFRLPGRTPQKDVRAPDINFVAAGRFPGGIAPEDFLDFAPDLAVEVLSPSDRRRDVMDKIGELLDAGTRLVWVIDPRQRRAVAYRSLLQVQEIPETGTLDGEDVLPGFSCPLAEIF
jgi:Uma2 family endonuclease